MAKLILSSFGALLLIALRYLVIEFERKKYIYQSKSDTSPSDIYIYDLYQSAHKIWITVTGYLTPIATFFCDLRRL
jgi:hypothetical protein